MVSILLALVSCELQEESISNDPSLEISFSNDSVKFDTLLTGRKSYSERLILFNRNENAVRLSSIRLLEGQASDFELIVNGKTGNSFSDEVLFGNDSILIIISTTPSFTGLDSASEVLESIIFEFNGKRKDVILQTFGLDVITISKTLDCNAVWSGKIPYLLNETVVVKESCTLTIEKGVQVFMGNDESLIIEGTLLIHGDSAAGVVITNDIFDSGLRNTSGQWGDIYFGPKSTGNQVRHAKISNGTNGLLLDSRSAPEGKELILENTEIKNMVGSGLISLSADIEMTNSIVFNCNRHLVGIYAGGEVVFQSNTFVNEGNDFFRSNPSFFVSNTASSDTIEIKGVINLEMRDNIIWGNLREELEVEESGEFTNMISIKNNIIKSVTNRHRIGNIIGSEQNFPKFVTVLGRNYQLDSTSLAINKGSNFDVGIDLTGKSRDSMPDIGAYEWFPAPDTTKKETL